MFCKRCGNENPEDAVYCIKCGYNMWDKSKQKPPVPNPSTESVSAHVSVPRHEHTHKPASVPAPSLARRVYPPKLIAAFILIGAALLSFFSHGQHVRSRTKRTSRSSPSMELFVYLRHRIFQV